MATKRKRTLSHISRPRSGSDFGRSNIDPGPFGGIGPVDSVPNVPGPRSSPSTTPPLPSTATAAASATVQHPTNIKIGGKAKKAKKKKRKHPQTLVPEPVPKHAQRRRELPVYACRSQLLATLRQHGTMVVKGETGSGKTTQIPQYLYEDGWTKKYGSMIAVTQPRRVAAMSVAERVAEEVGSSVGGRVGYRVRFDDATSSTTKIKFMTDGMLLRESMVDPLLSKYSVIVLDEAHERTLHTDILFAVVKQIQEQRNSPGLPSRDGSTSSSSRSPGRSPLSLIVMSATLDTTMFSNYFNNAPIVDVPGRTYPIEMFYTKAPIDDYVAAALTCILQVHVDAQTRPGDVLVFLTGQEEIEDMARLLRERRKRLPTTVEQGGKVLDFLPCPIYAAMPTEQQMQAFAPAPFGCRKIVLATNIAETSITIDGIRFVIDPGMVKQKKYVPATGMESLQVVPVSKAQAWQRAGRAGRQAPGQCYRLYTESTFRTLDAATVPEILRCSLATVILQLKVLGVKDVLTFDFLQPPEASSLKRSLQQLRSLGALKRVAHQEEMAEMATGTKKNKNNKKRSKRYVLTDLGRRMSELPLEPHYALALIRSSQDDLHCSENMLTIISMLSVENVFVSPTNQREKSGQRHRRFAAPSGDHVTLLNLYSCYMEECPNGRNAKQWLSENYINARAMHRAIKVRQQLVERCHQIGIPIVSPEPGTDPDDEAVRRGLVAGLFLHMAKMMPSIDTNTNKKNSNRHKFKTCVDNIQTNIHPSSTLFTRRNQQKMLKKGAGGGAYFVVFTELVYTKRAYIRGVSEIKQEWLMELAPQVFSSSK